MPDISKCKNETCVKRNQCWRFTAPDSEFRQCYGDFEPEINDYDLFECSYFLGIPTFDKYLKPNNRFR